MMTLGLLLSGCTRNNGDIGDLFGTWRIENLTQNGDELDLYSGLTRVYTWAFQSHIIRIQDIRDNMDHGNYYGTWVREDNTLMLDFTHKDDNGVDEYTPPSPLHLVAHGITRLTIEKLTSKNMIVSYRNDDGNLYVYTLRKVP